MINQSVLPTIVLALTLGSLSMLNAAYADDNPSSTALANDQASYINAETTREFMISPTRPHPHKQAHAAVSFPQAAAPLLQRVESDCATIRCTENPSWHLIAPGNIALDQGEMLITACRPVTVHCRDVCIHLRPGATVLVEQDKDLVRAIDLHDYHRSSTDIVVCRNQFSLRPGQEVIVSAAAGYHVSRYHL